jgi:hypothetical protein
LSLILVCGTLLRAAGRLGNRWTLLGVLALFAGGFLYISFNTQLVKLERYPLQRNLAIGVIVVTRSWFYLVVVSQRRRLIRGCPGARATIRSSFGRRRRKPRREQTDGRVRLCMRSGQTHHALPHTAAILCILPRSAARCRKAPRLGPRQTVTGRGHICNGAHLNPQHRNRPVADGR